MRELLYDPGKNEQAWDAYNALCERYEYDFSWVEDREQLHGIETELQCIVCRWPDFFMAYVELWQFYGMFADEDSEITACHWLQKAVPLAEKIMLGEKGNWPDVVDWAWIENRPVIRILLAGSLRKWEEGKPALARHTLRNILKTNPNDNPGVRFLILAINEGISYKGYKRQFEKKNGTLKPQIFTWFEENYKKYPEEFALYEKATAEMMQ